MAETMLAAGLMGRLLMLSLERLRQLAAAGHFPAAVRGEYAVAPTVQGYIKFLKDEERRNSQSAAQQRVADARARAIELRNDREEGKLIEFEFVEEFVQQTLAVFRNRLEGLPAAASRDLSIRTRIERYLNHADAKRIIAAETAKSARSKLLLSEAQRDAGRRRLLLAAVKACANG